MTMIESYAPGRAELLGNHTDYNGGLVLSIALGCGTTLKGSRRNDDVVRLSALDLSDQAESTLASLAPRSDKPWANYIFGVLARLRELGVSLGGAEIGISSTLPLGAGLSSSAALEIATAVWFKKAYPFEMDDLDLARVAQWAEHHYAGVRCGLLDQISVLMSREGCVTHIDCRSFEIDTIPVPSGAAFVLVNSGVKHALVDGEYNQRRSACEEVAAALGVHLLRDVAESDLDANGDRLDPVAVKRARHIVGENRRVREAREALEMGDLGRFGSLMFESHQSSREHFENSCAELDLLVDLAAACEGCYGARLSGGGFGGATINLVAADAAEDFAAEVAAHYQARTGKEASTLVSTAASGAR